MSKTFWIFTIAAGIGAVALLIWIAMQKSPAPLNASGYTYPSSPGA